MTPNQILLAILCLAFFGGKVSHAGNDPLLQCLQSRNQQTHRLDKENTVRNCYEQHGRAINRDRCYQSLKNVVLPQESLRLTEDIRSLCFYESEPQAKTVKSCLKEAREFKNTSNHDEAVFYCFQQFQNNISRKDCFDAARELLIPVKEAYLTEHCREIQ